MATKKAAALAAAFAARVVRDPRVMSDAEVAQLLQDADGDLDNAVLSYDDALRYLRRQKLVCRGPIDDTARQTVGTLIRQGKQDAALHHERLARGVRNRSTNELEPCGYDYVTTIEETRHPLDGSLMTYKCPKCGVEGALRVARLNVEDAPPRAEHERLHRHFLAAAREQATKRAQHDAQRAPRR